MESQEKAGAITPNQNQPQSSLAESQATQALGFLEVQSLVAAIEGLDTMLKTADVRLVHIERRLGGRMVTLVVDGSVSAVTEAVEAGRIAAAKLGKVKLYEVIARPHDEIKKLIYTDLPVTAAQEEADMMEV